MRLPSESRFFVRYSRMLSNFAYSKFDQMLLSRCDRFGIQLIHRNPAYSSIIGMIKFMSMYGLSSDTAAALVLARRGLRMSERIPSRNAQELQVDSSRHVWSHWNAIKKGMPWSRHSLFTSRSSSPGLWASQWRHFRSEVGFLGSNRG